MNTVPDCVNAIQRRGSYSQDFHLLPGETLYSSLARIASWSRLPSRQASWLLLGHPAGAAMHEIPVGWSGLERALLTERCGSFEDLVRLRTVLGAVLPFLSAQRRRQLAEGTRLAGGKVPRELLGMNRGEEQLGLVLRRCPDCVDQDMALYDVAFWHTVHQFPGVWVCPWHLRPLQWLATSGRKNVVWAVAHRRNGDFCELSVDPSLLELLTRVAFAVIWTASQRSLSGGVLRAMTRRLLRAADLLDREFVIRPEDGQRIHDALAGPLHRSELPHFRRFGDPHWVWQTLSTHDYGRPLRWAVLLASTLPHDWQPPACHTWFVGEWDRLDFAVGLPEQFEAELGLARLRAPQLSLGTSRTAKFVRAPESLYAALGTGVRLAEASRTAGLELCEAQRWLARDLHLAKHWHDAIAGGRTEAARAALEAYALLHREAPRSQVLRDCVWAVRALERYAPELLVKLLPEVHLKFSREPPLPFG